MKRAVFRASSAITLLAFSLWCANPREEFETASRALSAGDLPAAEQGFQQVLRTQPGHIGALGNLGVVYMREGRNAAAADVYRRALKLAPQDPLLNLNLGLVYLRGEDYVAATPCLETVLRVQPANSQARELLATARIFTGKPEKAIPVLEELRKIGDPGTLYLLAAGYLKLGKRDQAGQMFEQMMRTLPPAQAYLLTGRALYDSGVFEESVTALGKARDLDPGLAGVWRDLGKTYVSLRRSGEARQAFSEALKRSPSDHEAQYFLGALLVQDGDANAGAEWLEKARATRPDFWGIYYYLGKAAASEENPARAIEMFRRAAELSPQQAVAWYQLSRALKSAGRNAEASEATRRFQALRAQTRAGEEALVLK